MLIRSPSHTLPPVALETTRTSSPTASIEEIVTPGSKRQRVAGKGKEKKKANVFSSTIWDDERLALDRAHEVVTPADLRALSDMSLNDVASRHVHKLVQVRSSSFFLFFISYLFFIFFTDDLQPLSRCWERASTLPLSISLKRPRWHL